MKNAKRILATLLVAVMMLTAVPMGVFATSSGSGDVSVNSGNYEIDGDTALGAMLSNTIQDETQINSDYGVTDIDFSEGFVTVSYNAISDCTVLVGVYDEETGEMYAYQSEKVYDFEHTETLSFEDAEIPEYFILKAYLVDSTGAALCEYYENDHYTKSFKETFIEATISDFEDDKVINLDSNENTNFAVIAESTQKIDCDKGINELVEFDENKNEYIFSNIDEKIKELKTDDIFWYNSNENSDVIIIKVKDIKIENGNAIIIADYASLEETFDFIKIDDSSDAYEMSFTPYYDESDESDESTVESQSPARAHKIGVDLEGSKSSSIEYQFGKEGKGWKANENVKVTGSLKFSTSGKFHIYYKSHFLRDDYLQIEISLSASLGVNASINAEMKDKAVKKIGEVTISPCAGLYISFEPSIVLKASASVTVSGTLTATVGFEYNDIEGFVNKCEAPSFKPELKVEGEVFFGLDMTPHVSIIHEKVADAGLTAEAGFTIKAESDPKADTHTCYACLKGEIDLSVEYAVSISFVNKIKKTKKLYEYTAKLADFYYSIDHLQFGWSECPYKDATAVVEFNGHYYKVIKDSTVGWHDAEAACENMRGHLATVSCKEEDDFIFSLVAKNGFQCWLGGTDEISEGNWEWVTGEPWEYENADFNNAWGLQHYLVIYCYLNGKWDDQSEKGNSSLCQTNGYVCEWDSYKDYQKYARQNKSSKAAPARVIASEITVSNEKCATIKDKTILFNGVLENLYMIYTVDTENNVKYISQGKADSDGNVSADFYEIKDLSTYAVGDFGEGVISKYIKEHELVVKSEQVNPTCTKAGYTTYTCTVCGDIQQKPIPATGHQNTYGTKGVGATCTEDGLTPGTFCRDCNTFIKGHEVVPALGHKEVALIGLARPTCTEDGFAAGTACERCGITMTEGRVLEKLGHADEDGDNICDRCGLYIGEDVDPSVNCSHMCHQSGFMGFIWKILNIFNRIFGINKVCECGAKHY